MSEIAFVDYYMLWHDAFSFESTTITSDTKALGINVIISIKQISQRSFITKHQRVFITMLLVQ